MIYRNLFPRDIFAEMQRMQRILERTLGDSPSIRGVEGGYPAMNVGITPKSVEIYAFIPGMDSSAIDLHIERGTLTISGERKADLPVEKATVHISERFSGQFRRRVSLPEDVDTHSATAKYHDGLLQVSLPRKEAVQPRRIAIQ